MLPAICAIIDLQHLQVPSSSCMYRPTLEALAIERSRFHQIRRRKSRRGWTDYISNRGAVPRCTFLRPLHLFPSPPVRHEQPTTHSTRPATPGRSVTGGIGADGARGGGGGGGGFYGGGGGGSGGQGAGGGGGSSYADPGAVAFVEGPAGEWGREEGVVRVAETGESWVEVEWERAAEAETGEEPVFYEVICA